MQLMHNLQTIKNKKREKFNFGPSEAKENDSNLSHAVVVRPITNGPRELDWKLHAAIINISLLDCADP